MAERARLQANVVCRISFFMVESVLKIYKSFHTLTCIRTPYARVHWMWFVIWLLIIVIS